MSRKLFTVFVLIVGVGVLTGCQRSAIVVTAANSELTVTNHNGEKDWTYEVAMDATVTLDGEPAELDNLDMGDVVTIESETKDGKLIATEINAKSHEHVETDYPNDDREPLVAPESEVPLMP